MFSKILDSNFISKIILFLIILLPAFYLPLKFSNIYFTKTLVVYSFAAILSALALFAYLKLKDKSLNFNIFKIGIISVLVTQLLSTIFSANPVVSFWGRDFAVDSFVTILSLFIILCITAKYFKRDFVFNFVWTVIFTSGVISIIQILNILLPSLPSFGIFYNASSNVVGKINDLSLFVTIGLVFSVLTIEQIKVSKTFSYILYFIATINLLLILLINFNINLYFIAAFGILFNIYKFTIFNSVNKKLKGESPKFISISLIITLITFVAIFFGGSHIQSLSEKIQFNYLEVRPSASATIELSKRALQDNFLLGSGPATFEVLWPKFRDAEVLRSEFWNVDFRYGFSLMTSFVSTVGILGSLSWILFLMIVFWTCVKAFLFKPKDLKTKFILDTVSVSVILLWLSIIFYIPTITIFALAFVFTGIFIATLIDLKIVNNRKITINKNLFIIVCVTGVLIYIVIFSNLIFKFIAHTTFTKTFSVLEGANSNEEIAGLLNKSISYDKNDTYFRSLAKLKSNIFYKELDGIQEGDQEKINNIKSLLSESVSNYKLAIDYDNANYNNHVYLADFYTDLLPLKISDQDLYGAASDLYNKAHELRPNDPEIYLKKAKLEFVNGSVDESKKMIIEAIKIRPQYFEAYSSLSQLEFGQGNSLDGVNILKEYLKINPNDSNALYQLGLAHIQAGQNYEAEMIFDSLSKSYPDNSDIKSILNDLRN